jgi:hypothetical protein
VTTPARAPFDAADAEIAETYMREKGVGIIDPFDQPKDLIFTTSLSTARFIMEQSFGAARRNGQTFRGYPFIVEKPSTNAFAIEKHGLQLCGLEVGLVNAAYEISLFVFSQSSLFTDIGDAAAERSPSPPPDSQLAFWISDRLRARGTPDGSPIGLELIPSDPQRQLTAHFLTQLMLRFVWLHELYHGLNGHTGLLASERAGTVLNEMPDESALGLIEVEPEVDAKKHARLRHCMEYDADRSALWMLVRMQQIDFEPLSGLSDLPKSLRLALSIFAAAMMTFVFDQAAKRQARQRGATHPLPQHRLVDLVRTLASNLTGSSGGVNLAFSTALAEMNELQRRLPEFVSASRLMDDLRSTPLQRGLDEIDDGVTSARVRFAPYAYAASS